MGVSSKPFSQNRFLQILAGCYVVLWILLAIHPL
jgi:hypothetical protein